MSEGQIKVKLCNGAIVLSTETADKLEPVLERARLVEGNVKGLGCRIVEGCREDYERYIATRYGTAANATFVSPDACEIIKIGRRVFQGSYRRALEYELLSQKFNLKGMIIFAENSQLVQEIEEMASKAIGRDF